MVCFTRPLAGRFFQESRIETESVVSQEKTEAVVLRWVAFSETSKIVTFLTPGRGRLACIAKGVRRKNSPLAAVLETFNRVEAVYYWKDGRDVHTLGEAALLDAYRGVKADVERSAYAAFPLELAYKVAHENEPSEALFAVLTEGLATLDTGQGDARLQACRLAWRLLEVAGFAPALEYCSVCGVDMAVPSGFSRTGGAVCAACGTGRRLEAAVWAVERG